MKKRKFNLLINIVTLCLCISAIAFGVYSAKQASLNVSGTIGFTAHNCDVKYTASVANASDADGNVISETATPPNVTTQTAIADGTTWTLGSLYFDDLTNDTPLQIILTINLFNYSSFPIKATAIATDTMTSNANYSKLDITITNCDRIDEKVGDVVSNGSITITIGIKDLSSTQFELPIAFNVNIVRNTDEKKDYSITIQNEEYASLLEPDSSTGINKGETAVLKFNKSKTIPQPIVVNAKSKWESTTSGYTLTISNATKDVDILFGDIVQVSKVEYRTQEGDIATLTESASIYGLINVIQCSYIQPEEISGYTRRSSLVIGCQEYMTNTVNNTQELIIDGLYLVLPGITESPNCIVRMFVYGQWVDLEGECVNGTFMVHGLTLTPDQPIHLIDIFIRN